MITLVIGLTVLASFFRAGDAVASERMVLGEFFTNTG
jgi:hypothetical protein